MKKVLRFVLLLALCFLIGCDEKIEKKYVLDLSSIEESMNIESFDVSLIRIKEIINDQVTIINCNESMFTEEDYNKLQTVGTHTVTVIYKLFSEEFTITLYEDKENPIINYEIDLGSVSNKMHIDAFELSLIKLKEIYADGSYRYIDCNKEMISVEDYNKLSTEGTHSIKISYKGYSFEVTIELFDDEEPVIEYKYELDLGYLRDEILIDDFDLNLIVIKETDSLGNVKYIECNESMVSSADLNKLTTVGKHTITVKYQDFSAQVTINLIEITSGGDNPGGKDVFSSTLSYYSKANGLIGTELKMSLRSIITSTHKKVTTYAELKTYLQNADEDPNNPSNMILFYTGASVKKTNNMNTWNREHVWAQSLSNGWFGTSGAGADMHHIRPCNPGENSSRGNKKFGTSSGYYDPSKHGDDFRGDVARIIFYMFVRYTEADKHTFKSVAQSKELLLEWNKIDPVSETEIIRNDYTYTIQGNRNPFIDHPECADLIWGETNLLNNQVYEEYKMVIVAYIDEKKINEWV